MIASAVSQNPVLLSVESLSYAIKEQVILSDVSFDLSSGEFIGLLGPNGAGKSTLLRCIYRYYRAREQAIRFAGSCIQSMPQHQLAKDVAVVLQQPANDMSLSAKEVVALGLLPGSSMWHSITAEQQEQIHHALEQVGLAAHAHKPLAHLSGGEQQRVHIARALLQQPKLLVMDEPTSHLDIKYQIEIMELVRSLKLSVLASFHDINLASTQCDRLIVLNKGQCAAFGEPKEVVTQALLSDVFGVCADVVPHPQNPQKWPLVHYFYGYKAGEAH